MSESDEAPIHGEILEEILSRVPLIDLVSASTVSSSWHHSVSRSLRHLNAVKPWLLIYFQSTRSPAAVTTLAYDPRSHLWLEIRHPSIHYFSLLRSSHSSLLYMFTASRFVFSTDPLHLEWQESGARMGWRPDPIVAVVGKYVLVAGSACGILDDPPALEIYDTRSGRREWCGSMPAEVMDAGSSTWVSVAADEERMYVSVKRSGVTYWFEPKSKQWSGPYDLRPDAEVSYSVIGFAGERLIMVSVSGEGENGRRVVVWEVKREGPAGWYCKEMGEMPGELAERVMGGSIRMAGKGEYVFIQNQNGEEVIMCELLGEGVCRWEGVRVAGFDDEKRLQKSVMLCSDVDLTDISFRLGNGDLLIKKLQQTLNPN